MKRQTLKLAAALLTAGLLTTGCSSDDSELTSLPAQPTTATMTFKATVAAKGNTTRSVDASGETTWVEGEQIAVYYQKADDSYDMATANVDKVVDGQATISAELTDAKDGSEVTFIYPASLASSTSSSIDYAKLWNNQHGTIADISANFDAATATATLQNDGTTLGTTATISFTNQVLIGKFTPKHNGTLIDGITNLTVTAGSYTYTVTPANGTFGTDGIYVAMLPVSNKLVMLTAETAGQFYAYAGKTVTLEAGQLYTNLAIPMVEAMPLTVMNNDTGYEVTKNSSNVYELYNGGHYTVSGFGSGNIIGNDYTLTIENGTILAGNITYHGDKQNIILNGDATVTALTSGSESGCFIISGSGTLTATDGFHCSNIWLANGVTIKCPEDAFIFAAIRNASGTEFIQPTIVDGYKAFVGSGTVSGGGNDGPVVTVLIKSDINNGLYVVYNTGDTHYDLTATGETYENDYNETFNYYTAPLPEGAVTYSVYDTWNTLATDVSVSGGECMIYDYGGNSWIYKTW